MRSGNGSLKRILIDGGYIEGGAYYFYLTDHLGNNRVVANANGGIVQTNHYYPFGMSFAEGVSTSKQPYKYNGKELDTEKGLNPYDYSARLMDPVLGRFSTVDPKAEKYYGISPYVYCANNPLKYVDPDGRKIVIWYRNGSGKQESFVFNGQNISVAPKNGFVRSVIAAYIYDVGHGGGKNLKIAAMSSKFNIGVVETIRDNKYISSNGGYIRFNPNAGLQLNDGSILSPATGLEHEAAHGVNDKTIGLDNAPNANYHTVEERKVIKGAELDTAKANGELSKTHQGRKKHSEGQWIVTKSVTSNQELNTQQSEELIKKLVILIAIGHRNEKKNFYYNAICFTE